MGNTDSLPIISQVKSLVQVIAGDKGGARQTQENFIRECPVVSQVTSAVQSIGGDQEGARQTQLQFLGGLSRTVDGIPVVGHIKGGIHYAAGDSEGGDNAMKSASRTAGVVGGGVGGFLVGGPVGAVAGGIAGGAALDGITTGVESAINQEYCPNGYVAGVTNMIEKPDPGEIFDLCLMPVADGVGGYGATTLATDLSPKSLAASSGTDKMVNGMPKSVKIASTVTDTLRPVFLEAPARRYKPTE